MVRIALLHTAESNVGVFEAAVAGVEAVALRHAVRADLLAEAERAGGLTAGIAARTVAALRALGQGADAVLLTCSTLGPAADEAARGAPVPILRVDAALAERAVRDGGAVVVLCAVETTLEPTRRLFDAAVGVTGARVAVRLVPGAWAAFRAGDGDGYRAIVARAAEAALRDGAARVALAQASMAGACALLPPGTPVMGSPVEGLMAALRAAAARVSSVP